MRLEQLGRRYGPQGLVVAVTLVLGLFRLGQKSFWDDEGFSVQASQLPWPALLEMSTERDPHTALWHVLLKGWSAIGGVSETWLRLLPVILGALTALVFFHLLRRLADEKWATLGTVLLVVNETYLSFLQEARPMMLATFFVVCTATLLVKATDTDRPAGPIVGAGITGALALYGHPFTVFAVLALAAWAVADGRVRRNGRAFLLGAVVFATLTAPLIAVLVSLRNAGNLSWVPDLSPRVIATVWFALGGAGDYVAAALMLATAAGLVVFAARKHPRAEPSVVALLVLWALSIPAALTVLSMFRPSLVARYVFPVMPAVFAAATLTVRCLPRRSATVLAAALLIGAVFSAADWYRNEEKADWRSAVSDVVAASRPGDRIVLFGHRAVYDYYADDRTDTASGPVPLAPSRPVGSPLPPHEVDSFPTEADLTDALAGGRVWVITLGTDREADETRSFLEQRSDSEVTRYAGDLRVEVFD